MPAGLGQGLQLQLPPDDEGGDDQGRTHDQAGDHAGLEQVADGGVRNGTVHHEGDGGGNDDPDGAGTAHESGGEGGAVAGADHTGDHHQAQGCYGGRTGAGDGGKEAGDDDAHDGQTTPQVAHAGLSQTDQAFGDLGLIHDVAGQDKEGNGQQHELAGGRGKQLGQAAHDSVQRTARPLDKHGDDAGNAQTDGDGRADQQQNGKADKQNCGNHVPDASFPSSTCLWSSGWAFSS